MTAKCTNQSSYHKADLSPYMDKPVNDRRELRHTLTSSSTGDGKMIEESITRKLEAS